MVGGWECFARKGAPSCSESLTEYVAGRGEERTFGHIVIQPEEEGYIVSSKESWGRDGQTTSLHTELGLRTTPRRRLGARTFPVPSPTLLGVTFCC